jgi:hypothetical protein
MAGLATALRLAERGYQVTVYEQDTFVGGKYRAVQWKGTKRPCRHEHSYHMYLNWYHNFWDIVEQVGVADRFQPLNAVKFLRKGEFPYMPELSRFGSANAIRDNLLAGVLPVTDMFLYMYSLIDFLSTPMDHRRFQDLISVNGFVSTRPYITTESAKMYDEYLAKTFAVTSYRTSAKTFQSFLEYGAVCPEPMYYMLRGNCHSQLLEPLQELLIRHGVTFEWGMRLEKVVVGDSAMVEELVFRDVQASNPTLLINRRPLFRDFNQAPPVPVAGPLILALPPDELRTVLDDKMMNADFSLGGCMKLRSEPMASVHLHLNRQFQARLRRLGVRALPPEPVVLVDSKYKLSFVDCSQLWPDFELPYLNVVASDSRPLLKLRPPRQFTRDRESSDWDKVPGKPDMDTPNTMLEYILRELREFIHFEDDEIDVELLEIDVNVGRELFINDTGSWDDRPETVSKIKNLFLAADFCQTPIDVVSLEGAVVAGLQAAEAVRERYGGGPRIEIKLPERYPHYFYWPAKLLLAPYAGAAKLWSSMMELADRVSEYRQ